MGRGKFAAQVAHTSPSAYEDTDSQTREHWKGDRQKKVVLKANGEPELFKLADEVEQAGTPRAIIRDAGHVRLDPDTVTALATGPVEDGETSRAAGDLSLY